MRLSGVVVRDDAGPVAVVTIDPATVTSRRRADRVLRLARPLFPGMRVALTARDEWGRQTWYSATGTTTIGMDPFAGATLASEFTVTVEPPPERSTGGRHVGRTRSARRRRRSVASTAV